jgi:hypothetical protein
VNGSDLKFRDLKVFLTNRPEDTQMFNELRALAQPLMQNGGSLYDVIELYSTKSMREMKKTFKDLRDRQVAQQDQAQQLEQQKLEQQSQQAQAALQQAAQMAQEKQANEDYQKELDRINKKEVALINALGRNENAAADVDDSGVADALEVSKLTNDQTNAAQNYQIKMQEIQSKMKDSNDKKQIELEKIAVARENMQNDLAVAKENAKGRNNKKG